MNKVIYVVAAVLLGLLGAALVFPHAQAAPARYIGSFTAPWFAAAALFLVVILPPALAFSKLHRVMGMRRVVGFIGGIAWLGALTGIYMALRWIYESQAPVLDWVMVISGTVLVLGCSGALLYWGMQEQGF